MLELKRVMAATDFSECSNEAIDFACGMADKFGAELHLVHVLESHPSNTPVFGGGLAFSPRVEESQEKAEQALELVVPEREAVRATTEGPAFLGIIRYAKDNDVDLIVMGTHGVSGLAHVMIGSVAERVVRKAHCPVLTVRHSTHEYAKPFES